MNPSSSLGTIEVQPNPATPGSEVEVQHTGAGALYYNDLSDPDSGWKRVEIDPETGKGKITVPPGSMGFVVSNRRCPPDEVFVEVLETKP